jgi:uncharacterized protein (TIGR02598 family)
MRKIARKLGRSGFSIVEAIIGAGVIAAGILALISLFPVSSDNLVASAGTTAAVAVGTQKIEDLKNTTFPAAPATTLGQGTDNKTLDGTTYTRTWTAPLAGTPPNRTATVTVAVTWPGRLGTLTFTSIIAE